MAPFYKGPGIEKQAPAEPEWSVEQFRRVREAARARKAALEAPTEEQHEKREHFELEKILRNARELIQEGKANGMEGIELLRFAAEECSDKGRAVNNKAQNPDWPLTLPGDAKELYDKLTEKGFTITAFVEDRDANGIPDRVLLRMHW